jgi:uncharacterized protein
MPWFERTPDGWLLSIHAQPGAKQTAIAGLHGNSLKLRVQAAPIEGRANEAIIAFLAERLGVPKRLIGIVGGEHSRLKRVEVLAPEARVQTLLE